MRRFFILLSSHLGNALEHILYQFDNLLEIIQYRYQYYSYLCRQLTINNPMSYLIKPKNYKSLIGNETGRSIPFKSSLIPIPFNTKRGAVTRLRRNSDDKFNWKNSFICLIPNSVCFKSSNGL